MNRTDRYVTYLWSEAPDGGIKRGASQEFDAYARAATAARKLSGGRTVERRGVDWCVVGKHGTAWIERVQVHSEVAS